MEELYMFPSSTIQHIGQGGFANPKLSGQSSPLASLAGKSASDFLHLLGCEFGKVLSFATRVTLWPSMFQATAFLIHVNHIVCMRPQEKVIRAYASRIVAMMTYEKAFWDISIGQFISNAVSQIGVEFAIKPSATLERTVVPGCYGGSYPNPATINIAFINLLPEALFKRFIAMSRFGGTGFGAIKPPAFAWMDHKVSAANKTLSFCQHVKLLSLRDYIPVRKGFQCAGGREHDYRI